MAAGEEGKRSPMRCDASFEPARGAAAASLTPDSEFVVAAAAAVGNGCVGRCAAAAGERAKALCDGGSKGDEAAGNRRNRKRRERGRNEQLKGKGKGWNEHAHAVAVSLALPSETDRHQYRPTASQPASHSPNLLPSVHHLCIEASSRVRRRTMHNL